MSEANPHVVQLVAYGAILIVTPCPRDRPGVALLRACERVGDEFGASKLSKDTRIDRLSVTISVTGVQHLEVYENGIRRLKGVGRVLFTDVVVPPQVLTVPDNAEFEDVVCMAVRCGVIVAARTLGHSEEIFRERLVASLWETPKAGDLFAPFISGETPIAYSKQR
jgi:hypothetical protein